VPPGGGSSGPLTLDRALGNAAEQLVGSRTLAEPDRVDKHVPGPHRRTRLAYAPGSLIDLASETGKHPLRRLQEAASGRDLSLAQATWPPSSTGASQHFRHPKQDRYPAPTRSTRDSGPSRLGQPPGQTSTTRRRPRRPDSRPRNPSRRSASLGSAGKPPEHRTDRRHSRVAGRPRHRPQRPTANRRAPTRGCREPMETTPRPRYRPRHRAAQLQRRSATGTA
jgi:hypothetical protein